MTTNGFLMSLRTLPGREEKMDEMLRDAAPAVREESATAEWFAMSRGRGDFRIFGAFVDAAALNKHLDSTFAHRLLGEVGTTLEERPHTRMLQILASKLPTSLPPQPDSKGLLLTFKAQEGHEDAALDFLTDAQPHVAAEAETTAWFALRFEDGLFGLFATFPDNGARLKHLVGYVPQTLAKNALTLLGSMPDMEMLEVLAGKLPNSAEGET